ncbi:hypothetical protein CEXT_562931 [Caerostris extrusa]|uniref:Uncharacterized protein n=1 Tax=Caerostris extrusa TaxID=172846 RepID=A0AAV4WR59_CAEEX|nr:hypothetical protein CEXT_562931 [Caerostris extrusa]
MQSFGAFVQNCSGPMWIQIDNSECMLNLFHVSGEGHSFTVVLITYITGLEHLYPFSIATISLQKQTQKTDGYFPPKSLYKYSYSCQSNIQSLLIPSPLHWELNCISGTPLASRDCCHEQKTSEQADDHFFRCPNPLQNCGRPRDLTPGERLDKTREIAP